MSIESAKIEPCNILAMSAISIFVIDTALLSVESIGNRHLQPSSESIGVTVTPIDDG